MTAQIIIGIVLGLLALYVKAQADAPSSIDQPRRPALRERLRRRIRDAGWCLALAMLAGCTTPAVYIPAGEPVRLAETIRGAKVEVMLPSGAPAIRTMDIPAGWFALPDPGE